MSKLQKRLLVAAWGIPLFVLLVFTGSWVFALAVAVVSVVAQWEFYRIGKVRGHPVSIALIMGFILPLSAHFWPGAKMLAFLIPGFLLILLYLPAQDLKNIQEKFSVTLAGIIYPPLFLSYLVLIRDAHYSIRYGGAWLIIFVISAIWICDTMAYFGGSKFGKHKLAPVVSPNKTWEGAIFGMVSAVIWALLLSLLLKPLLNSWECIGIGLIVGTVGQLGDLAESSFKRSARIKDSSSLFGPHGGMLDRFDSIIAVAPALYVYLVIIGKF